VLSSAGAAATDLGVRGARFALGLRELVESSRLAMTIGPAVLSRPLALDAIIESVAQLAAEPAPPGAGAGVRIDGTAAGLVGDRYELLRDAHGLVLAGERSRPDDGARLLLGKRTPFVGRTRELRQLRAAVAQGLAGEGAQAVVVSGAAGIGKSRLCNELVRALEPDSASIWPGRADPLRQATPFGLLAPTLRAAAGIEEGAAPEPARQRLAELARDVEAAERPRVVEFLGELCGLPPPADASEQLRAARGSPLLLADQLQRAWEDLVLAVTRRRPLLVVLEDLHWADAPSLKLADAALRVARDRALVLLATTRPDGAGRDAFAERAATRIRLGELPRRASVRLVAAVLGERVDRSQVDRLAARGAGNALYLEELIRAAADGGRGSELPGSVKAMAMARLEALDAGARRVLRAGSIFGESFWPAGVAALLGDAADGLDEQLLRLREREWLGLHTAVAAAAPSTVASASGSLGSLASLGGVSVPGAGAEARQHRFRHDVLREAAYAALTDTDRRLGHRLAGEWLERHGEHHAATLATHFERGGDRVRAGLFHARAAEQALAASDLGAALEHAAKAAACGARGEQLGELRLVEAVAHHWRAAHDAEHRAAMEALRLLPPLGASWYRAVEELAEASLPLSDVDTLVALADALEEAPEVLREGLEPRTAFRTAAATLTMQLALAGRREAGLAVMARLEASLADGAPPPPLARARAEFARATLAMIDGDLGRVIERARAAVGAFEEAGDLRDAALMRSNLAWALAEIGAWAEAERELRAAAAIAERMGLAFVLGGVKNNLGLVLARRGQLDEALVVEEESATFYRAVGNLRLEGQSRIYLAMIHGLAGALEAAEREARAAVGCLELIRPTRAHALAQLAQVLLAQQRGGEAAVVAAEAAAILDELGGIDEGEALVRLVRAETLALEGREDEARATIAEAKRRLLARAARISDEAWRESFVRGVPENARTLELAEAWKA
jgi:tetratricopeptide (TPR) repeat protein